MIAVFDNFIKDESLIDQIKNDENFFSDPGSYYYWNGWWNSTIVEIPTLKQRLIHYIWGDECPIKETFNLSGFEYWTGIQTANTELGYKNNLGIHFDKDEAWFEKTGEIKSPVIGTVYYPPIEDFEGGDLAIYTDGIENSPEIVKAKPNRLIIFDAGNVPHEVLEVIKGTRHAIAINLWSEYPYSSEVGSFKQE